MPREGGGGFFNPHEVWSNFLGSAAWETAREIFRRWVLPVIAPALLGAAAAAVQRLQNNPELALVLYGAAAAFLFQLLLLVVKRAYLLRHQKEPVATKQRPAEPPAVQAQTKPKHTLEVIGTILDELKTERVWPEIKDELAMSADFQRVAALLKVTNFGQRNLSIVTARCTAKTGAFSAAKYLGLWSGQSGGSFVTGGSHKTDLAVGDPIYLLVAHGVGRDGVWARVPEQPPYDQLPKHDSFSSMFGPAYLSDAREALTLGSEIE
jgi:hypothetical protein